MNKDDKSKQASWGGRFKESTSDLMLKFSESVSYDKKLALFDIEGSKAHAAMLAKCNIITQEEADSIISSLEIVLEKIETGDFEWKMELEDVHMNVEQYLTSICPAAAKLHTARSRNDQVATDMRLYFKHACYEIIEHLFALIEALSNLADKNKHILIPGYTHLQRAQPVSVAHHILAWANAIERDIKRFENVFHSANISPLGSGAIAGTTLKTDRAYEATLLGFCDAQGNPILTSNSMDAVSDRDVFMEFASACSILGVHISRISEDMIIFNSAEFGFVKLSDAFTTGSSLMPQKKNPDSFELLRGKSARLIGNMTNLFVLVKGLPLTYNRDLQEDKIPTFDSHEQVKLALKLLTGALATTEFNEENCAKAVSDPLFLATDLADYLVERGVPFRNAHHIVGALVALAEKENIAINEISNDVALEISADLGENWKEVFSLERAMKLRRGEGMPSMENINDRIKYFKDLAQEGV